MRRTLRRLLPLLKIRKSELHGGKDCNDNRSRLGRDVAQLLGRNDVLAGGYGVDQNRGAYSAKGRLTTAETTQFLVLVSVTP